MPITLADLDHGDLIVDALKGLHARIGSRIGPRGYTVFERYMKGDHPLEFASSGFIERFGAVFRRLCDNYAPLVVNTLANRLIVDSLLLAKGETDERLSGFLNQTRFDSLQRSVHRDAALYGDAYVLAYLDVDGPRLIRQRPWTVAPIYDQSDPSTMLCAVKTWIVGSAKAKRRRVTVYYPDRFERYICSKPELSTVSASMSLIPFGEDGEPEIQGHAFGRVPVAHFANDAGLGEFGVSELEEMIPLQAMLNKHLFDLLIGMESSSWAQRWITGIDVPIDPKTRLPDLKAFEGGKVWIAGKDGKFGQLPGPDPAPIVAVIESTRAEIARIKGIPAYYMNTQGETPSGAALRVTEAPLQAKVEDRQVHFGNVWESIVAAALGLPDDLTAVWRDTSPVSLGEQLDTGLTMKTLGLPTSYVLQRCLGVTAEEAQDLIAERRKEDEAKADLQQRLMARAPELP
jgi:hypothetical protein